MFLNCITHISSLLVLIFPSNRQLTTCLIRMNQYKNKKSNELKIERLNIAKFLRENNPEAVRIKVERIIRDEYLLEALDLMVPLIEVLQSRRFMLEQMTYF